MIASQSINIKINANAIRLKSALSGTMVFLEIITAGSVAYHEAEYRTQ